MTVKEMASVHPELKSQREYGEQLALKGSEFALVAAEAFVRGIRDIGYKSTATALDELIDNSIQAGATRIDVVFGFGGKSDAKPDRIAIIDNGHGMDPDIIRAGVMWGGTHREGDRNGFGRYGYGLPSSCVSQGKRFSVYSRPADGVLHYVELDIEDLGAGMYNTADGLVVVPPPVESDLPNWLYGYGDELGIDGFMSTGTAVIISRLDRLTWVTMKSLERNLLQHFGVTYRNYLRQVDLWVNGKQVEPIDPLFVTEGFRHFDVDEDRAESLQPLVFSVKDRLNRRTIGSVNVRYSSLPPTFPSVDKSRSAGTRNANARFPIMKDHLGIIFLRSGRQIDVVTRNPWTQFQNNDRYWNVEVDFTPGLDEEFSITTSKQQIVVSDRMWDLLKEQGVFRAIEEMRGRLDAAKRAAKESKGKEETKTSEQVMKDSEKFKTRRPAGDPTQREEEAEKRAEEEVSRRARQKGLPKEEARAELLTEIEGRPYKVDEEHVEGGPIYRPEQLGGQFVLWLNTSHRFYTDLYTAQGSNAQSRDALELVLFTLGEAELDSSDERRLFYQTERQSVWTSRLSVLLELLSQHTGSEDDQAMEEEIIELGDATTGAMAS